MTVGPGGASAGRPGNRRITVEEAYRALLEARAAADEPPVPEPAPPARRGAEEPGPDADPSPPTAAGSPTDVRPAEDARSVEDIRPAEAAGSVGTTFRKEAGPAAPPAWLVPAPAKIDGSGPAAVPRPVPRPRPPITPAPHRPALSRPAAPPLPPGPPPRPRVEDDQSIIGLSRVSRSRFGSRLFTWFFVFVFALIFVQMVVALLAAA